MGTKDWLELIAVGIMALCPVLLMIERLVSGRGIGVRAIQVFAIGLVVPLVLILALESKLSNETLAALIGSLIGYLLSGIGEPEGRTKKKVDSPPRAAPP